MNKNDICRLIEQILQWEGEFNSQRLMQLTSLSRQSISKLVNQYREQNPQNMVYDASKKVYRASEKFIARTGEASFFEYLNQCYIGLGTVYCLPQLQSEPQSKITQPLIKAIRLKQRIDIRYVSMSSPEYDERIISPHSLVFDGKRYHVRAWCEKNQEFRDFVLSRIHQVYALEGLATRYIQDDINWHKEVSFLIEPDARLTEQQKKVIALDYGMHLQPDGRYTRKYQSKIAMLIYFMQHLRVDIHRENPQAQQVVLTPESALELAEYLP